MVTLLRRRDLLLGGGLAALSSACARSPGAGGLIVPASGSGAVATGPSPLVAETTPLGEILQRAITAATRAGASYADARIVRKRSEWLSTREDHVVGVSYDESYGIGIRVVAGGAWGFAATSHVEASAAEETARRAVAMGKANAAANETPVVLAPAPAVQATWGTPMRVDPFTVSLEEKTAYLLSLWEEARQVKGVEHGDAHLQSLGEWKMFASSDGSRIEQAITRIGPQLTLTAIDKASGEFESVRSEIAPMQAGWEYVTASPLKKDARRLGEDVVRKLKAPPVTPGKRDVILAPSNLWLTIHESCGHSTELDRALGYEANLAGTSFATPEKRGHLQFGSPRVHVYADKTTPGGLATCAYDDDGVKTQRWDLIKDGVFVGYQTTREQAGWIGESASRGTSYAQDFQSIPFQRMPNVSVAPSEKEVTVEQMIAATDDGIYATGDASWSIDHQRYNFQFGAQMAYEVKKGKIVGPVRRFAYQSNSIEFWNACDMIGGKGSWALNGALNDGKGQPEQSNPVSHGTSPARFRQINVLDTTAKKGA
jgi:TldD protein